MGGIRTLLKVNDQSIVSQFDPYRQLALHVLVLAQ